MDSFDSCYASWLHYYDGIFNKHTASEHREHDDAYQDPSGVLDSWVSFKKLHSEYNLNSQAPHWQKE